MYTVQKNQQQPVKHERILSILNNENEKLFVVIFVGIIIFFLVVKNQTLSQSSQKSGRQ